MSTCACGHTDYWHGNAGEGWCEATATCRCDKFVPLTYEHVAAFIEQAVLPLYRTRTAAAGAIAATAAYVRKVPK